MGDKLIKNSEEFLIYNSQDPSLALRMTYDYVLYNISITVQLSKDWKTHLFFSRKLPD